MQKFEKLFEPIQIGDSKIKNRIVMAPMATCLANENGAVTDALIDHYVKRAVDGMGLIVVAHASISPARNICRLGIYEDHLITGLRELLERIKESAPDVKVFVQLNQYFGGKVTASYRIPDSKTECASTVNEMSSVEIKYFLEMFVKGAVRAKTVGFDGIELHGAHRYLINQFLSPFFNQRTDEYGGNIEKNMRFALEMIAGIRGEVGNQYPIMFRLNGSDFVENGLSVEDVQIIAGRLSEGVDAIHVSAGVPDSPEWTGQPMGFEPGCLVPLAEQIKKAVSIPVIAVGKINDLFLANSIVENGKADMVAIGRGLLADPEFFRKTRQGKTEEIRKCISCRYCLSERVAKGFQIRCKINPTVGRERDFILVPAKESKKVIVVGGGPAGMEVAAMVKRRGHAVKLFERQKHLGGQLLMAMAPPCKREINDLVLHLETQVRKLDIPVTLNCNVTAELIEKEKPDMVIAATGAKPWIPDIPGVNRKNVVTYKDVLTQNVSVTGNKTVIVGGGEIGCECADYIRDRYQKCQIIIIEMIDEIATGMETVHRSLLLNRLQEKRISMFTKTRLIEINEQGTVVEREGKRETFPADMIVLAMGSTSENGLAEALKNLNIKCYEIGDCFETGKLEDAFLSAWKTALVV